MAEVFISYSQKDRALIAPIAAALQELGVDAWYDREISAGERFGDVIRARLKEAKAVLVCWSPEAVASQWVDSEADYARELGAYVPIFAARCALMPPFNRIHTDDLSQWTGARDDPAWIKLVDRLAQMIAREGVAAGARALASGDEAAKYEFARRYPDEPLARKIWASAEARLKSEFASRLAEARAAASARIDADRAALEARLSAATPVFEAWLVDERRGAGKGPKPDPLLLVEPDKGGGEKPLLERIDALSGALAKAKAREGALDAAKAEVERLAGELAGARAVAPPPARGVGARTWVLSATVAVLALALVGLLARDASAPAPTSQVIAQLQADLDAAKHAAADADARAAKLQADLSASQAQVQTAAADAQSARASAAEGAKKLADATAALAAANDRVAKLQADLAASQAQAQAAGADAQARVAKLQADLTAGQTQAQAAAADGAKKLADATAALAAANDNIAKLQSDLAASQAQAQAAAADAAKLRVTADDNAKKLSAAMAALEAANDGIAKLQADLAASQARAQPQATAAPAKSGACGGSGPSLASLASRPPRVLSAAEECALKAGDEYRECAGCPAMLVIPQGTFMIGSPATEPERVSDEGPQHEVRIAKPFAVGMFTVTFDEWDACVAGGGCGGYRPSDEGWGRGRRPVINVSWNDAQSYVKWLSSKTSKPYRLLSESEWEYAARAGTTTAFWEGATISPDQANYNGTQNYNGGPTGVYRKQTVPVGGFAPNAFGLYDMNGNVWQWVEDCYNDSYSGAPQDGSPLTNDRCGVRVLRSGSWFDLPRNLRAAVRFRFIPGLRDSSVGFRVARTLSP